MSITCGIAFWSAVLGNHHGVPGTSICWPPCCEDDGAKGVTDWCVLVAGSSFLNLKGVLTFDLINASADDGGTPAAYAPIPVANGVPGMTRPWSPGPPATLPAPAVAPPGPAFAFALALAAGFDELGAVQHGPGPPGFPPAELCWLAIGGSCPASNFQCKWTNRSALAAFAASGVFVPK